jgi:hypothetical protein
VTAIAVPSRIAQGKLSPRGEVQRVIETIGGRVREGLRGLRGGLLKVVDR